MQTVLITGANRGIGSGLVRHYLNAGWQVIGTARVPEDAQLFHSLREDAARPFIPMKLDVGSEASIGRMAAELKGRNLSLDLMVNNAGISVEEAFGEWTADHFIHHFRINSIGPALVAQAVVPFMNEGSKLINISSGMGSLDLNINSGNGLDAYAMSKAALNMLTRRLAEKLKLRDITVAAMNPGWVQTDMGGREALLTVDESVKRLTAAIDAVTPAQSGRFYAEDGGVLPW
jgi:NAD(P)-dependent dehydrogenase (short-subunit alcohol dehydrogenase family)